MIRAETVKTWLEKTTDKLYEKINADFVKSTGSPILEKDNSWCVRIDIRTSDDGHRTVALRTDSMAYEVLYDPSIADYNWSARYHDTFREKFEKRFEEHGLYLEREGQGVLVVGGVK